MSVKLNDLEFSGNYKIVEMSHDSGTPQELNLMNISRQDGAKLVSSQYSPKEISISGYILGDTVQELEENMDSFKKAVSVTNGNLDMDYAGYYRRYKVNCNKDVLSRKNYNLTFAMFEISFVCCDPPFAKKIDSIGGDVDMTDVYSVENISSDIVQDSFSVLGTAVPKANIKYKFDNIGDISSVDFINLSTSKQINVSTAFTSGDELLVDHDNLNVALNGEPVEFEGVFPELKLGSNSFETNVYLSSGTTLDQSQTINNYSKPLYGQIKLAQSFQVSTNCIIPKIQLLLKKVGEISSDISIRIETDSASAPSGTAVTNGTATIAASSITSNATWVSISFTDCDLSSGTTYWVVISTTSGASDNYYEWKANNLGGYSNGNAARYFNSWASLGFDFCFKIYKNVIDINNSNENYESAIEGFSTTTNKDAGNTTANWDTSSGHLLLNYSGSSIVDSYSEANVGSGGIYLMDVSSYETRFGGQSFTGNGKVLSSVKFYLKGANSPSGNMIAYLYAHTGTYGTTGVPTGSPLATSNAIDAATLTTNFQLIEFTFPVEYTLVNGTHYFIVLYYNANVAFTDEVIMGWGSDKHGGNACDWDTSHNWQSYSYGDIIFYVYGKDYDTSEEFGQSNALDSYSSVIASAKVSVSSSTPTGTSVSTLQMSSDGTNFENVVDGTEKYFTNIGSSLKFKVGLTGTVDLTPYIDTLTMSYKLAGILTATTHRVAQSFLAGFTGNLGRVMLNVKKFGSPGAFTVNIYSDSGGNPNASLASQTYSGVINSDAFGWIAVNFASPASLSSGTTYWIVISAAGVDSTNGYLVRSRAGNVYTSGTMKYSTNSGGAYTEYTNEDILFKTYASSGLTHQYDLKIQYNQRYL